MHGAYDSPQPFMYGYQSQHQGPQRQMFTPHDLQVLARMRDRPVVNNSCILIRDIYVSDFNFKVYVILSKIHNR